MKNKTNHQPKKIVPLIHRCRHQKGLFFLKKQAVQSALNLPTHPLKSLFSFCASISMFLSLQTTNHCWLFYSSALKSTNTNQHASSLVSSLPPGRQHPFAIFDKLRDFFFHEPSRRVAVDGDNHHAHFNFAGLVSFPLISFPLFFCAYLFHFSSIPPHQTHQPACQV